MKTAGVDKLRIMIVEDEREIRDILKNLLEDEGFEVETLEDGMEIVSHVQEFSPDLLLLDQLLPGKLGNEVVKELRSNENFATLPIIIVTGLSGEDDKVNAL